MKAIEIEKQDFTCTVQVNASAAEAMKKISQVDKWWAKNFTGSAEKPSDKFRVDFGKTFVDFEIAELIPGKKVVWKVTNCNLHWLNNRKEWNGTEVVFELLEKDNLTQINFTHIGLVPGIECYENCYEGWTGHITESLVKFIDEGQGMPE
ncbi:MAG: SRPBCC domain-containing protein [Mucilaginibacter sp.]